MTSKIARIARENMNELEENSYPGRGIVIGIDEKANYIIQIYWIMGRSENSRNQIFVQNEDGSVETQAADPTKVKDPSLIIYTAMAEKNRVYVVSNGHQTLPVLKGDRETDLNTLLMPWIYEPDAPNFTPRITARVDLLTTEDHYRADFATLSKSAVSENCLRTCLEPTLANPGFGYCITTYDGDGDPLPSFQGTPYLLPLQGDIAEITETFWQILNEENKVSLAVKFIDVRNGKSQINLVNKYVQVEAEV